MSEVTKHAPGTFCWIELGTTDAGAAKKFYSELFGWSANDIPAGPGMIYTMLQLDGKDVAALYELTEQHRAQGVPSHWLPYVAVASADESAEKVTSLGGKVIMAPFDVMDVGRMSLIQDPAGAMFALWEARKHIGATLVNQPGTVCWNELATRDSRLAGEFYTKLFGWGTKVQEMGPTTYTIFTDGERQAGGMLAMTEEWGNIPSHWMAYFGVEDCDASANKARALGATIKVPPTDIPGVGRFAVLQDAQGAAFSIIKLHLFA